MTSDVKQDAWERSYENKDNFVFYPHEEVLRFLARKVRKRVGPDSFVDIDDNLEGARILDVGCGIGRHVLLCHTFGFDAYGFDLSNTAIEVGREWLKGEGIADADKRLLQSDIRDLPFPDDHFNHMVTHGVLDSMPMEIAIAGVKELKRVIKPGGLFYCDLIAAPESSASDKEEVVQTQHELGTVQSYFNKEKIETLFEDCFEIVERVLVAREVVETGHADKRWHLILKSL